MCFCLFCLVWWRIHQRGLQNGWEWESCLLILRWKLCCGYKIIFKVVETQKWTLDNRVFLPFILQSSLLLLEITIPNKHNDDKWIPSGYCEHFFSMIPKQHEWRNWNIIYLFIKAVHLSSQCVDIFYTHSFPPLHIFTLQKRQQPIVRRNSSIFCADI